MGLGPGLKNDNGGKVVSDLGSQDTQRSQTKPEGGAVSVKHDRDTVRGSCYERFPEVVLLIHSGGSES